MAGTGCLQRVNAKFIRTGERESRAMKSVASSYKLALVAVDCNSLLPSPDLKKK